MKPGGTTIHFDAQPLIDLVEHAGTITNATPAIRRAYARARKHGWVTTYQADQLAITLLKTHPAEIWGTQWETNTAQIRRTQRQRHEQRR